jgi:hypothetical protein
MISALDVFLLIILIVWVIALPRIVFFIHDKLEARRQRKGWEWIANHYKNNGHSVPDEVVEAGKHWSKK